MKKKIAVIGGGIYGITVACRLSEKYSVDLFEENEDILMGASGINQFRLHRGYHYPRSEETTLSALKSEPKFREEYREAIIDDFEHYYVIAKKDSLTSGDQYISFLKKFGLEYTEESPVTIDKSSIDLCVKAKESNIDPKILYRICWEKLNKQKVNVLLKNRATEEILEKYDHVIVCTYANINSLLKNDSSQDYQFELCEKILAYLPKEFKNQSIVVMDGPFGCLDPYGRSDLFLLGHVTHAIHQSNIGRMPMFDKKYVNLINNDVIKKPFSTNFQKFIESMGKYMPKIREAKYFGSFFTFRVVVPKKESTDERLHYTSVVDKKIITVFSGKIANCVEAAEEVTSIIDRS